MIIHDVQSDTISWLRQALRPVCIATLMVLLVHAMSSAESFSAAEEAAPSHSGDSVKLSPDWKGVWRDTGMLFGSQVVVAGVIYALPESFSGWSHAQKNDSFKNYSKNVFDPVIDKDEYYINYGLHPYWGATYYIRARERGLDKASSFVYSALISATYEFGIECLFEKPSIQDLTVTPVGGLLVGALIFEPLRESIKRKDELRWYDHTALVLTDPVGVLSLGVEKMLGVQSTVLVEYTTPQFQSRASGSTGSSRGKRFAVTLQFPLN